jgi:hypothetical protein
MILSEFKCPWLAFFKLLHFEVNTGNRSLSYLQKADQAERRAIDQQWFAELG